MTRKLVQLAIAATGVAFAFWWPIVGVLVLLVALNLAFGRSEPIPLSTFGMFSNPPDQGWSLRFEGPDGGLAPIGHWGINPVFARKRFSKDVSVATKTGTLAEAQSKVAHELAALAQASRPLEGPWASQPVSVVLVTFELVGGSIEQERRVLATSQ